MTSPSLVMMAWSRMNLASQPASQSCPMETSDVSWSAGNISAFLAFLGSIGSGRSPVCVDLMRFLSGISTFTGMMAS